MLGYVRISSQGSATTLTAAEINSAEAIPIVSESLEHTIETIQEESLYARYSQSPTHRGMELSDGALDVEADYWNLGYMLMASIGQGVNQSYFILNETLLDTGDGKFAHIYDMGSGTNFDDRYAGQPVLLEVYRGHDTDAIRYFGMVATQQEITIVPGDLMSVSTQFTGAGFSRDTKVKPSYTTRDPFKWDNSCITYDGGSVVDMVDLSISIGKSIEPAVTTVGCSTPYKFVRSGGEEVTLSGTMIFQSDSYSTAYENFDTKRFFATFNGPGDSYLSIDVPSFRFSSFDPVMSDDGLVEADFEGDALYNTGSGTALQIILVNSKTTQY